jgi:hypothetical protein
MHSLLSGWEPYVAILGLLLTTYALYLERSKSRYPSHLTCYTHEVIPLAAWITRSLPDLSILYRDIAIGDSTFFLSAYLVHTGHRDISQDMVAEPLTVSVPEGYRWLAVHAGDRSPELSASVTSVSDSVIAFDLGLFRVGEYVEFVALVDCPPHGGLPAPGSDPSHALRFHHRITDTGPVDRKSLASIRGRNPRTLAAAATAFLLTLVAASVVYFDAGGITRTLAYYRVAGPGLLVHSEIVPNADGTVTVQSEDGLKAERLRGEQLTSQYRWSTTTERSPIYPWVALLFTMYLILAAMLLVHQAWKHYHFSRLPHPLRLKHA